MRLKKPFKSVFSSRPAFLASERHNDKASNSETYLLSLMGSVISLWMDEIPWFVPLCGDLPVLVRNTGHGSRSELNRCAGISGVEESFRSPQDSKSNARVALPTRTSSP